MVNIVQGKVAVILPLKQKGHPIVYTLWSPRCMAAIKVTKGEGGESSRVTTRKNPSRRGCRAGAPKVARLITQPSEPVPAAGKVGVRRTGRGCNHEHLNKYFVSSIERGKPLVQRIVQLKGLEKDGRLTENGRQEGAMLQRRLVIRCRRVAAAMAGARKISELRCRQKWRHQLFNLSQSFGAERRFLMSRLSDGDSMVTASTAQWVEERERDFPTEQSVPAVPGNSEWGHFWTGEWPCLCIYCGRTRANLSRLRCSRRWEPR